MDYGVIKVNELSDGYFIRIKAYSDDYTNRGNLAPHNYMDGDWRIAEPYCNAHHLQLEAILDKEFVYSSAPKILKDIFKQVFSLEQQNLYARIILNPQAPNDNRLGARIIINLFLEEANNGISS